METYEEWKDVVTLLGKRNPTQVYLVTFQVDVCALPSFDVSNE